MKARDAGGDIQFDPAPQGMHVARCISLIDLGTKHDQMYDKEKHEIFIMWELPHEIHEYTIKGKDGEPDKDMAVPFTVSRFYTLSLSDKAHLRDHLESSRTRAFTEQELQGFEMKNILGQPCMVNVIHSPKKNGNGINSVVKSVTGLPKNMECPPAVHDLTFFSLDPEEYDERVFEELSKGIKALIMRSNEYIAMQTGTPQTEPMAQATVSDEFDDIPF